MVTTHVPGVGRRAWTGEQNEKPHRGVNNLAIDRCSWNPRQSTAGFWPTGKASSEYLAPSARRTQRPSILHDKHPWQRWRSYLTKRGEPPGGRWVPHALSWEGLYSCRGGG